MMVKKFLITHLIKESHKNHITVIKLKFIKNIIYNFLTHLVGSNIWNSMKTPEHVNIQATFHINICSFSLKCFIESLLCYFVKCEKRATSNQKVEGSSPSGRIILFSNIN